MSLAVFHRVVIGLFGIHVIRFKVPQSLARFQQECATEISSESLVAIAHQ